MAIQRASRKTEKTAFQTYMELKQRQNLSQQGGALPTFAGNFAAGMEAGLGADAAATPRVSNTLQGVSQGASIPASRSYDPAVSGNYNTPGAGLSSSGGAVNYNSNDPHTNTDAHEALYQAISEAEGTTKYGYNTVYGGGNGVAGKPLTGMTIRDVLDHQSKMIRSTNHSPLGRFQITRDTLQEHYKKVGLSLDSKFDQTAQNKLALSIAHTQGLKPTVWAGFSKNPTALARAKAAYNAIQNNTSVSPSAAGTNVPTTKSGIMAMQKEMNAKGANLRVDGIMGPRTKEAMAKYGASTGQTGNTTAYQQYMASKQPAGAVNTGGVQYSIRDKTSASGLTPGLQGALGAAQQAARAAGLDHITVVAGKGQGHLSHQQGSEADVVGYNADGSKWSKAQRVAVAQGAAGAGANRFGFYSSGNTLHMGMGAKGLPSNVVWNDQVRGVPGVQTFAPEERAFVTGLRTGKPLKTTYPTTTAANVPQPTGYSQDNSAQVKSIQRELQARGATDVAMDGIVGPKTQAAAAKYGLTGALSNVGKGTVAGNKYASLDTGILSDASTAPVDAQYERVHPISPMNSTNLSPVKSSAPIVGREVTPSNSWSSLQSRVGQNPYTNSTGGAFTSDRQDLGTGVASPPSMNTRNMRVPTQAVDASGYPPVERSMTFSPPARGAGLSSPYVSSNSLRVQTTPIKGNPWSPHLPGADNPNIPVYGGVPTAVTTTSFPVNNQLQWSQLQMGVPQTQLQWSSLQQAIPTAAGPIFTGSVGGGSRNAEPHGATYAGGGERSGMGYAGGNYQGGTYGGAGGASINQGVGGAYKNR